MTELSAADAALIANSSLADPEFRAVVDEVSPETVADLLRRVHGDDTPSLAATADLPGAVEVWEREMRRLLERSGLTADDIVDTLLARSVGGGRHQATVSAAALARIVEGREVTSDAELAGAVVDALGGNWETDGYAVLHDAALQEVLPAARRPRAAHVSGLPGAEPTDPDGVVSQVDVPVHERPVHGRADLVERLLAATAVPLASARVLVGESGYGKTTVARAVADAVRCRDVRPLWISADDLDSLTDGLRRAAARLGASVRSLDAALRAGRAARVGELWKLLDQATERWLIVLDDAGPGAVRDPAWLHRSAQGSVIVTTRFGTAEEWGPRAVLHEVGPLSPDVGARLVLDRVHGPGAKVGTARQAQARRLAERLGGVPLALVSAAEVAAASGRRRRLDHVIDGSSKRVDEPVATALAACLSSVSDANRDGARDLLRFLACFAVDAVIPAALAAGRPSDVLDELVTVGLVSRDGPGDEPGLKLHPAVAELARGGSRSLGAEPLADALVALRVEGGRLDAGIAANWPRLGRLRRHAEELLDAYEDVVADGGHGPTPEYLLVAALHMADTVATGLMRADSHDSARTLLDRAMRLAKDFDAHPAMLDARQTMAWIIATADGDLADAEWRIRKVLKAKMRVHGRRHPSTLGARDRLAWLLAEQGQTDVALRRFEGVLIDRTETLGARHPDTLATRHRLAWVLSMTRQFAEAEAELRRIVELRIDAHGTAEHLDVHTSQYRLAWVLAHDGRLEDARVIYEGLRNVLDATVGRTHSLTLMVRSRLAWVATRQSRLEDAHADYVALLADQVRVLGEDHSRTLRTRHALAKVHLKQGSVTRAARELGEVARERDLVLGADHPFTLDSRSFRAWALFMSGRTGTASRELQAVLADRRRIFGDHDPATLRTQYLLARVLARRGQLTEAERRLRALLVVGRSTLDPHGRLMLEIRHAHAYVLGQRGQLAACESGLRGVLADREAWLGTDHRDTIATRDYLSWAVGAAGRIGEALELCQSALTDRLRLLGPSHLHTHTSRYRRAWLLGYAGRPEDALDEIRDLEAVLEAQLGPDHPDRLRCRAATVWLLRLDDRPAEAEPIARAVIDDHTRIHGPDDLITLRSRDALGLVLFEQEQLDGAQEVFTDVLAGRLRELGPDHPHTLVAREHLALVDAWRRGMRVAAPEFQRLQEARRTMDVNHPDVRRAPHPELLRRVLEN